MLSSRGVTLVDLLDAILAEELLAAGEVTGLDLAEFSFLGRVNEAIWTWVVSVALRAVLLSGCGVEASGSELVLELEELGFDESGFDEIGFVDVEIVSEATDVIAGEEACVV